MSLRPIITGEHNPILRAKSSPVIRIGQNIKKLAKDLIDTLEANPGIGLAAPQISQNIRVILVKLNPGKKEELKIIMLNPEILEFSSETEIAEEGCLSLPGIYLNLLRSKEIKVQYQDLKNRTQLLKLKDLNARIVQHEIDHLDGILIVDKGEKVQSPEKSPNMESL